MNADGTTQTRITSLDQDELNPRWSPDGTKIAVRAQRRPAPRHLGRERRRLQPRAADHERAPATCARPGPTTARRSCSRATATARRACSTCSSMNANGTNQVNITNTPTINEDYPSLVARRHRRSRSRATATSTRMTPAGTNLAAADHRRRRRDRARLVAGQPPDRVPHRHQHQRRDLADELQRHRRRPTSRTTAASWTSARRGRRPATRSRSSADAFKNAEVYTMNPDGTGRHAHHEQHADGRPPGLAADAAVRRLRRGPRAPARCRSRWCPPSGSASTRTACTGRRWNKPSCITRRS